MQVSQLFEDQPDLLEEFTRFLPDNSSSAPFHDSQHGRILPRFFDRNSAVPASRQMHLDKVLSVNFCSIIVHEHPFPSCFPYDLSNIYIYVF